MRALLVQVAAAQNIMVVASKDVFCLSVQRTMALIFVESAMSFHVKKRRDCLKKCACRGLGCCRIMFQCSSFCRIMVMKGVVS